MRKTLCFCLALPSLSLKTRIIVIGRFKEIIQPSNTARFVPLVLTNSSVYLRGQVDRNFRLEEHTQEGMPSYLLYPDFDAPYLEDLDPHILARGINLIVPDGNWRQTSKVRRREAGLVELPIVQIKPKDSSLYRIRTERKPNGLATLEAIAYALGVLESQEVERQILEIVRMQADATLEARGQPSEENRARLLAAPSCTLA